MAATVASGELGTTSIGTASWSVLAASWLAWMFDGYEIYALVLVMTPSLQFTARARRGGKALEAERRTKSEYTVGVPE